MANASNYAAGKNFNSRDAVEDRGVVVMVTPTEGSDTSTVVSAGTVTKTSSGYVMTVENDGGGTTQYIFDSTGQPVSTNAQENNYSLMMAETTVDPLDSTVANQAGTPYTRGTNAQGEVIYTQGGDPKDINIENLNAKDQFAIQILKSILDKTKDPSTLSKTQIAYYCETAYNWAGYMMKESSQARAVIKDTGAYPTAIEEVPVKYLADNTEKLLNNIAAALDKTNAKITVGQEVDLKAERITIPELNKLIGDLKTLQENYVKDGNNTVGLKDLISTLSTTLTSLKTITSIGSINSLPDIEGNINSSVSGTITATLSRGSNSSNPLYVSIPSTLMDTRIKAWLNATTIVADGSGWKLNVPSSI
jgi:hypothetical protein